MTNEKQNQVVRDPWVLEVQQWLNKTYSGKSGYNDVPESGNTGWSTVYGLIRAVQIELGLSPADNFGDGTKAAWDSKVTDKLKNGYKSNIVKLIDGAFRCKGFGNGKFDTTYNASNETMITDFKKAAGFTSVTVKFESMWAKALFDMSAFQLVSGGNSNTRKMQQMLNRKYSKWTGILPCDGIYQRATNMALIYGVQVELGLGDIANGNFGPSTQSTYGKYASAGLSNYPGLVLLVQYGLYQNVKDLDLGTFTFSSKLDNATTSVIAGFQQFMKLSGVQSGYPDLRTMMSLTLSNGDTSRPCSGCDTSYQLTQAQIDTLKIQGFSTVGRYLTGSVGSDFKPKSLSKKESLLLFKNGMKIFAIYQDNVYIPKPEHFNADMGFSDARKAIAAARGLGVPLGETIYFAIDVDCQDWEIATYVLPYFKSISEQLQSSGYSYGVYGTRNVCQSVESKFPDNPPKGMFVSNMSSGFSGNLGFPQPKNWTYDQFHEYPGGIGSGPGYVELDKVAVSGKDNGFSALENDVNKTTSFAYALGIAGFIDEVAGGSIQEEVEYTVPFGVPNVEMKVTFHAALTDTGNFTMVYDIKDSKLSAEAKTEIEKTIGKGTATNTLVAKLDSLCAGVKTGQLAIELEMDSAGNFGVSLVVNSEEFDFDGTTFEMSVLVSFKISPKSFSNEVSDAIKELEESIDPEIVTPIVFLGTLLVVVVFLGGAAISGGLVTVLGAMALFLQQVKDQVSK